MCGIGGFISQKPLDRSTARRLCTALLYYSAERGTQSAGIFVNGKLYKKAVHAADFIDHMDFFNLFEENPKSALIHTRQPTCGGLGDAQAQPFKVNNTVSVHNGFFFDTDGLKEDWNIKKKSGVDSELVPRFIDSYGIFKLPKFLETTWGPSATATIYKDKLYFMRSGNPTVYTRMTLEEGNQALFFASTEPILRNALKYVWLIPWNLKVKETKENVLIHARPEGLTQLSKEITPNDSWGFGVHSFDGFAGETWSSIESPSERSWRQKNEIWRREREEITTEARRKILKSAIASLNSPQDGERGQENAG